MAHLLGARRRARGKFGQGLQQTNLARREAATCSVDTWDDFVDCFRDQASSFCWAHWDGDGDTGLKIKEETKATIRCIPLPGQGHEPEPGRCVKTGAPSKGRVLFSKNY